jgi:hypothetical protein
MKHCMPFFIAVFVSLVVSGCSKHSTVETPTSTTYTDLGEVEVSDGVPIRHALADGRAYIMTPTILKNGHIDVRLDLQVTNASGEIKTLQGPTSSISPGNQIRFSIADVGITMTPRAKP